MQQDEEGFVNKDQVKVDLIAQLRRGVRADVATAGAEGGAAQVDEQDVTRVDDISQEDDAGDLHGLTDQVDEREKALADAAETLDFSPTDVVRPGAVIELDGAHYVVGVASSAFTSGGVEYSGIAVDAPIYSALEDKKAGDTISFGDATHRIGAVR